MVVSEWTSSVKEGHHTCKQKFQVAVKRSPFVVFEFDDIDARHVAPEELLAAEFRGIVPTDERGNTTLLQPLRLPVILLERCLAVALVDLPVGGLAGLAAVLRKDISAT